MDAEHLSHCFARIGYFCLFLLMVASQASFSSVVEPGNRPLELIESIQNTALKQQLNDCRGMSFSPSDFSIGHRGAPLGYPEHSLEGYVAAAEMGAGLIECDAVPTKDGELVCRHSECDLATTTNILQTPLARKCSQPFTGATSTNNATAKCCTSDLTLKEFETLCARADASDPRAKSVNQFLRRTESPVIENPLTCGKVMSHRESIELVSSLDRKHVPELKGFGKQTRLRELSGGFEYRDKIVQNYQNAGVSPSDVFLQSFDIEDVLYWKSAYPKFGENAVWLDGRNKNPFFKPTLEDMQRLKEKGIDIIAPPIPVLVRTVENGELALSDYARFAKSVGLRIMTWTFESYRVNNALYSETPGRMLEVLDFLSEEVGVIGIFSDWPGTVTYYANCMAR